MQTKIGVKNLILIVFVMVNLGVFALPRKTEAFQNTIANLTALKQKSKPAASSTGPVILTDKQGQYPLGLHLDILEDPTRKLTIEQVSSPDYASRFTASQVEVPNFGFTDSVYWVRVRLDNENRQTDEWLLEIGFADTHYVDLYIPRQDSEGFDLKQTGVLRPPSTRDILYPLIIFNLNIPSQSEQTYYLRFQRGGSMTLPLTLWTKDAFLIHSQQQQLFFGFLFGAIMILLVYHLFLLLTLREASYLYFVLMLASLLALLLVYDDYLGTYLFPNLYTIKSFLFALFYGLFYIVMVLFSDAFCELKKRLPKLHWVNIFYAAGWGVLLLLIPFTTFGNIASLMTAWALLSLVIILATGIASLLKGFYPARFFLAAWLVYLASFFVLELVRLGVFPSNNVTENLYEPALIFMAVCWSIAQADRINLLKAQTENANRNLRNSEGRLSQILEGMPLGVVLYTKDHKPKFANRRSIDILSDPARGVHPDISVGRTIANAIEYFSLKIAGSHEPYPLENFPVYTALHGNPASADDIEMERGEEVVPLELWASPIRDETGVVESAVLVFQDITQRKQAEAELVEYRKHLESLVEKRTTEFNTVNNELRLHNDWLSAINQINQVVARSADFRQIYQKILEIINLLLATQDSSIAELDENRKRLKILAHSCSSNDHTELIGSFITLPVGVPDPASLLHGSLTVISQNQISWIDGPFGEHIRCSELQSIVLVPLQVREQVLGFLGLEMREEGRTLTSEESNLLNIFSTDIAQLLENARLIEQAKLSVVEEERNRIARELHDSVAQALYTISLYADAIRMGLQANRPQGITNNLEELIQSSRDAMADMRLLIFQLHPPILDEEGLVGAIQSRLDSVETKAGVKAHLEMDGDIKLTTEQETELYWIAQEILNNVIKHAHANEVKVELIGEEDYLRMTIEDNGVGFDPDIAEQSGGYGLHNIRERAEKIGAACMIASAPGRGVKISVEMDQSVV